jgi:ABC-type transport system involved in multi-copper enzyme maturation permease subunit
VTLGLAFAAIAGSSSITGEHRHGTIRPTLQLRPGRTGVFLSKVAVQAPLGAVLGAVGTGWAVTLMAVILQARDLELALSGGQIGRLVLGAALAGTSFALLGLALGTVARSQVPAVIGLLVWILFIENLLRVASPSLARFAPTTLGRALTAPGEVELRSPLVAGLLLVVLAACCLVGAGAAFLHRDID